MKSISVDRHSFFIDLHDGTDVKLSFKQFDNKTRQLVTIFTAHDSRFNLDGARVDLWVYKPDNTMAIRQAKVLDTNTGMVEVDLTRQMLACHGNPICEYVITYSDGRVVSFPPFLMEVKESFYDEDKVVSTDEFNLFFDSLARMEDWILKFNEKYNVITRAFDNKFDEVSNTFEAMRSTEQNRFDGLYTNVLRGITEGFTSQYTKNAKDFEELITRIETEHAILAREAEKRFNQLEQKAIIQTDKIEEYMNTAQENLEVILENREQSDEQLTIIMNNTTESRLQLDEIYEYQDVVDERLLGLEGRMDEFDLHYEEAKAQEAERVRQENMRLQNETSRTNAETLRQSKETTRQTQEEQRVINETLRQQQEEHRESTYNQFAEGEATRVTNENTRVQNEQTRQSNETLRQSKEQERQSSEAIRVESEVERNSAEQVRLDREKVRVASETNRVEQEVSRTVAEEQRQGSEEERRTSEATRKESENLRVQAERERQEGYVEMREMVEEVYTTTLKYRIVE